MADKKKDQVETSSTTLAAGTVVHGPKELIDRLSGGGSGSTSTTSSSTSRRKTSADQ